MYWNPSDRKDIKISLWLEAMFVFTLARSFPINLADSMIPSLSDSDPSYEPSSAITYIHLYIDIPIIQYYNFIPCILLQIHLIQPCVHDLKKPQKIWWIEFWV